MTRPPLNKDIAPEDFKNFYWLKEELIAFCREHGIRRSGGKMEIAERIEHFLRTGENAIPTKVEKKKKATSKFDWKSEPLSRNTIITNNYQNTQNVREYFSKEIGAHFKFNIQFMAWMKANLGKTLADAALEWQRLHELKKDKNYKAPLPSQLEYNTYTRDFFADNPNATRADAIRCWKLKKALPGTNKYEKSDLELS